MQTRPAADTARRWNQAVCAAHGIPCITVRVISDAPDEDLPLDFNALTKPDKNLDFGKFVTFDVVLQDAVTVLQTHNPFKANARVSYPVGI